MAGIVGEAELQKLRELVEQLDPTDRHRIAEDILFLGGTDAKQSADTIAITWVGLDKDGSPLPGLHFMHSSLFIFFPLFSFIICSLMR